MFVVTPPASDLVTANHPYQLVVDPGNDTEHIALTLRLQRAGDPRRLVFTGQCHAAAHPFTLTLDGTVLGAGEYSGELLLAAGERAHREPVAFYRMPAPLDTPFPVGIYAVPYPENLSDWDQLLQRFSGAGINLLCQHMSGIDNAGPFLDRAARYGIRFMPSDNLSGAGLPLRDDLLDRLSVPESPDAQRQLCVNQPEVRRQAARALAEHLREYATHPAFSRLVYYGDDLFLRAQTGAHAPALSCYCEACRTDYRAHTGGDDPPVTTPSRRGIVPADDPWLRWQRYRCGEIYGGFIRALEAAKNHVDPAIQMGLCHGFPQQPFTRLEHGIYGPLTQPTAVVSSYCYPYLVTPRVDLISQYALGRMGQRDKPVWMLGAINSNGTLYPEWMVYQNYWNMLAAGYAFIGYFGWWDMGLALERGETARVEEEMSALARCGAHAAWVLPTAKHWRVPEAPFAALYSFTTEAFDLAPEDHGCRHLADVLAFARLALQAGVPLEVTCEEELLAGRLDRYQAICLPGVRALPDTVQRKLADYIAHGGVVYIDRRDAFHRQWEDQVQIPGAQEAAPETIIAQLVAHQPPAIRASNPLVTVRTLTAGAVQYIVAINNAADRTFGMQFHYDSAAANEHDISLVNNGAETALLEFSDPARWLYDQETGVLLGKSCAPLALRLEPSWGRVFAALPCARATLAVSGDTAVSQGQAAHLTLEMRDPDGKRLDGAFTARMSLTAPSGKPLRIQESLGLTAGQADIALPIGLTDEEGSWTVTVIAGFPRMTITRTLRVTPHVDIEPLLRLHIT